MPIRPSSPILVTTASGTYPAASHSVACGFSSPSANARAMSTICCCSSVRIMDGLRTSPGKLLAGVIVEMPGLRLRRLVDDAPHASDALLDADRRAWPAHVGLDPAGMEQQDRDAAPFQLMRRIRHRHV